MPHKFRIRLCSDVDYEEMLADICYENQTVALVTQENGKDKMEIEIFFPSDQSSSWKFSLDEFALAIQTAKEDLLK
ncbi:MAG: hypothetical protein WCF65_08105 [Parachlamydiaceae bacterium]